jgi:hypothetical protein
MVLPFPGQILSRCWLHVSGNPDVMEVYISYDLCLFFEWIAHALASGCPEWPAALQCDSPAAKIASGRAPCRRNARPAAS